VEEHQADFSVQVEKIWVTVRPLTHGSVKFAKPQYILRGQCIRFRPPHGFIVSVRRLDHSCCSRGGERIQDREVFIEAVYHHGGSRKL